ncbi:MAG: hypothetical protein OEO79_11525 [Gemmatimonadota bacterium]|nr:hypothetical protein [Gemmatimonadota bacterium]
MSSGYAAGLVEGLEYEERASVAPAPLVALAVTLLLATSSFVSVEPALCDILFGPVLVLVLITGHMVSPLRLPGVFLGSIIVFMLANYASMASAWAWDVGDSWFYLAVTLYMLAYFVFFAGFLGRFGQRGMEIMRDGYLLAALITATIGVLAAFHILPNSEAYFRDAALTRVKSTFKDPNVFAPFLVGAVFLGAAALVHAERMKIRYLLVVVLSLIGVTLSFSRGAWVHLAVSLVAYLAMELILVRRQVVSRRLLGGLAFVSPVLVAGVFALLVTTDLGSYLVQRLSFQSYDADRFANQFFALELADRNLLGIGPGQYMFPRFSLDIHNLYLRVLVENGVVGLLALLTLLGASLFYGLAGVLRRGPNVGTYTASVAVIMGIMVESLVIDTLHWRHFFFFLSIPVGLMMYERSRPAEAADGLSALPFEDGAE